MVPLKSLFITLLMSAQASASNFAVQEVTFTSQEAQLSGSIVFPENRDTLAGVVFVHGSGKQARNLDLAKRFAQDGIAALVYDKRGAGKSGGVYEGEQSVSERNITLLADDASAALAILKNHPRLNKLPVGLSGISQAGWIVPLAAQKNDSTDFIVLWSAPVCKVSQEDIYSKYTADVDSAVPPHYQEALLARSTPYVWPDFLGKDTDPNESLAKLGIPGLWIFGERDGSIPVDLSIQRLKHQARQGGKYEYVLFSNLGHNNMAESFATANSWIKRLARQWPKS